MIYGKYENRVADIVSRTRIFKSTYRQAYTEMDMMLAALPKRTPYHEKRYLRGIFTGLMYQIETKEIEFCYLLDGVWHSTYKGSDKPRVPAIAIPDSVPRCHMWIGTEKPFTEVNP